MRSSPLSLQTSPHTDNSRFVLLWCMRLVIVLQCVGLGGRYFFAEMETESDVYGLLYFDYEWPEVTAQRIDDVGTLACVVAGGVLLVAPLLCIQATWRKKGSWRLITSAILEWVAALVIAVWFGTLALTHMLRGEAYAELSLGEHAVRILLPLAFLLVRGHSSHVLSTFARRGCLSVLSIACAATFAVHGYKALEMYPPFTDLILLTDLNWTQWTPEQSTVERALSTIGVVDIIVAALVLGMRFRTVAIYMAFWGAIAAASRMTAFGITAWPETMIRAANWGAPLSLAILLTISHRLRLSSKQTDPA